MQGVGRFLQSDILEEGVDCGQPRIPSASGVLSDLFQVFQESAKKRWIEVFDRQIRWHFSESVFGELQKQAEGIPISCYGVRARLPLPKEPICKEGLKK
jgi:hypothetical protein